MRNHRWLCSMPVCRRTRINSQESFGTSLSSEKGTQQLQQQHPQTSQLHTIGHGPAKLSNHYQMNTWQEEQRREQHPYYRCGRTHSTATCRFRDAVCNKCNKKDHLAKVYHSKRPTQNQGSYTTHHNSCSYNQI